MKKQEPLRRRLARTHTVAELEDMLRLLEQDPDSKRGAVGVSLYNSRTLKRMDEITWAIYYITKPQKPEYIRQASDPETKNW